MIFQSKTVALYYGNENRYYTFQAKRGLYKIECWGAMGFSGNSTGGCGGYVSGFINIDEDIPLYIYPGGRGKEKQMTHAFNGGGTSQRGGGGASDVRLDEGNWSDFQSLKSRIIVAGGGGGKDHDENPGAGGGLEGLSSAHSNGGTQIRGGESDFGTGEFGIGGSNNRFGDGNGNGGEDGNGAGGGGYFGGSASVVKNHYTGAGGSSFISGHAGCNAIDESSTDPRAMIPTNQSIHYTGYKFFSTTIIDGISQMPNPSGGFEIGHCSDGAVRIQLYTPYSCQNLFYFSLRHYSIISCSVFIFL